MTVQSAVSPCVYPTCDDGYGNPQLTTDVMCDRCRRHYRRVIDWLVLDYVEIKHSMTKPRFTKPTSVISGEKVYGHPAEWASDTARLIAQTLNWIEDGLREHLSHEPPPHPLAQERILVNHAYRYLSDHFHDLCTYAAAEDSAVEIHDLHRSNRRALGYTRTAELLPTPCIHCNTRALVRTDAHVECRGCGIIIEEDHYGLLARHAIDSLIDAYDTRAACVPEKIS